MITELTTEQKSRFPEFVERWTKIGLSTEPADIANAEKGIQLIYQQANLKDPKIVWRSSPLVSVLTCALIVDTKSVRTSVWASVWASVGDSVWASVRASVGDSVRTSVGDSVWDSGGASLWASVIASVWVL